jgi:predicted amidohydrolase YtcJ
MTYADLTLINGKVLTIDSVFTVASAIAISDDRIIAVGTNSQIRKLTGRATEIIDLKGRTVIPGLNDSHLHPDMASLSELEDEIPDVHTIDQLLNWIGMMAKKKEKGEWIRFKAFFSTRLIEMRQPALSELDSVAPDNPVFLDGSFGGMINSSAMRLSGISGKTNNTGVIKDKINGKPTGFLRASAYSLLKLPPLRTLSRQEKTDALKNMITRYNRYGITSLCSGSGDYESIGIYSDMREKNILTARIYQNILFKPEGTITRESAEEQIGRYEHVTGYGDEWVRIGPLKIFLDGGILTGTAFMEKPWGEVAGKIYGIEDKSYRGVLNYTHEELSAIVTAANNHNWSFTAHATGDGSVNLLLDVFDEVNAIKSIKNSRFSIIHGNFYSADAISKMAELGVYANAQAAWFYKDADAMLHILGEERVKAFHPYRSMAEKGVMINGGSDHMVKWDADASINPYNPFLAIWTMVSRETERGSVINPDEAITREEALRTYTINNAYASFEEDIKGSIEPGKLADIVILTDDIMTCPIDSIRKIESYITIVGGKIVYRNTDAAR